MNPLFFGPSDRQLFGIYHPPRAAPRDVGVLLCYPAPQEYMRTHWAMRRLATLLAQRGFHVLRFDYYATGDSAGEGSEADLEIWRDNITVAAAELRDIAGVSTVSVVGLRLGASLAALATTHGLDVADLVLWEPVVRGAPYVQELERIATRKFARLLHHDPENDAELIGYPFPSALATATRNVDLLSGLPKARRVLVFSGAEQALHRDLIAHLTAGGLDASYMQISEASGQAGALPSEAALLSSTILQAITGALETR